MRSLPIVAVLAGLAVPRAGRAEERAPTNVQDPPGAVSVDQPAAVSFEARDTPRDTTDPMHAEPYADLRAAGVTPGARGGRTARVATEQERANSPEAPPARAQPAPGREVRAGQDAATGASVGTTTGPATGTAADTALGTDIGHGTGTEQPAGRR